jgi:hypothetical protein
MILFDGGNDFFCVFLEIGGCGFFFGGDIIIKIIIIIIIIIITIENELEKQMRERIG